jgi:hypothetical protein
MGFFSWDCLRCGVSMRSEWSTDGDTSWLERVVVIEAGPNGRVLKGQYDGYGRVHTPRGTETIQLGPDFEPPSCWHRECWSADGSPGDWRGPSRRSQDQGFFLDEDEPPIDRPTLGSVKDERYVVVCTGGDTMLLATNKLFDSADDAWEYLEMNNPDGTLRVVSGSFLSLERVRRSSW